MGFFHADDFLEIYAGQRDVYIGGRVGSGKTLLGFALAEWLLEQGVVSGVWSNITHYLPRAETIQNAAVVIDEAGQFASNHFDVSTCHDMYGRWKRKTDSYYIFPSVDKVQANLRNLQVCRIFDMDLLPIRVWFYEYTYSLSGVKRDWFALVRPENYFDIYDHTDVPVDDGGTLECLCGLYPEVVVAILEARQGIGVVQRIIEKYGYSTSAKKSDYGKSREFVELIKRIERLEAQNRYGNSQGGSIKESEVSNTVSASRYIG